MKEQLVQIQGSDPGNLGPDVPSPCPTWQGAKNAASSYGPVIAYPPLRLQIVCSHEVHPSQVANAPACRDTQTATQPLEGFKADVDHASSRSAVQGFRHQSSLMLGAQLLDYMNQSIGLGRYPWACILRLALTNQVAEMLALTVVQYLLQLIAQYCN